MTITPVSIVSSRAVSYPAMSEFYSPSENYPEYRLGHRASVDNSVYALVRRVFTQIGLDAEHLDTPNWNPLRALVPEGSRVFVLCNFVYHQREHETDETFQSKCIHGSVMRALIDYLLLAVGERGYVTFGNAPLQSTEWDRVQRETGAAKVLEFYRQRGLPVAAADLRLFVAHRDGAGRVISVERRDNKRAVEVDLGADSLLAEISRHGVTTPKFRVTDYDPRRIELFHQHGHHTYVIHRDVLAADVVVSLSKLKTHEKVGITCGLKGFVGAVAHKDCLAHHRFGAPRDGGDEYPDKFRFLRALSSFHDRVYGVDWKPPIAGALQMIDRTVRRLAVRSGATMSGAWHGNDTAWRMALDLARILAYATTDGVMCDRTQRRNLSFIDGIIAGEGEGPLNPKPVRTGTLIFGDDVVHCDRVACHLMGFSPSAIPLVHEALRSMRFPLATVDTDQVRVCLDGTTKLEEALPLIAGRMFEPSSGWRERLRAGMTPSSCFSASSERSASL